MLDSIDDAIEGAEAVIAATEGLRDALLHDLLTRGLPGQHTEFRDVPGLGTVPADWEVVRLGDVIEDGPTNGIYKPDSDYGSGVCLIRIDDFSFGEFASFGDFKRIRATEEDHYVDTGQGRGHRYKQGKQPEPHWEIRPDSRSAWTAYTLRVQHDEDQVKRGYRYSIWGDGTAFGKILGIISKRGRRKQSNKRASTNRT